MFVTGGAAGIGAEFVAQFARQGARVGFVDIRTAGHEAGGRARQPRHHTLVRALRRERRAAAAGRDQRLRRRTGSIDVLVNNAADDKRRPVEEMTEQFWDTKFGVNLRPIFFAAQGWGPGPRPAARSIINLGSITWRPGVANAAAYATAKAGIEGLTGALARDLGAAEIRVNCLIPGWTMTKRQLDRRVTPRPNGRSTGAVPARPRAAGRHRPDGAVAGRRRQPDVHQPDLGRRRRLDLG